MKKFEQFEKIDFSKFVAEVFNTAESLYLSLPSIDEEVADALILVKKQKPNIRIKLIIRKNQ